MCSKAAFTPAYGMQHTALLVVLIGGLCRVQHRLQTVVNWWVVVLEPPRLEGLNATMKE